MGTVLAETPKELIERVLINYLGQLREHTEGVDRVIFCDGNKKPFDYYLVTAIYPETKTIMVTKDIRMKKGSVTQKAIHPPTVEDLMLLMNRFVVIRNGIPHQSVMYVPFLNFNPITIQKGDDEDSKRLYSLRDKIFPDTN